MSRAMGVDIGTATLKVAEIEYGGREPKIIGLYEMPRPPDAELGTALQAFFASQNLRGERVGLGLGDTPIFLKRFQFPFGDRKKVQPAIQGEFEDELPLEIETCLIDFKPVGRVGRLYDFIAGLVPSAKVHAKQNLFESSGTAATFIGSDVEAIAQLALHQGLPAAHSGAPYAVCDIGHSITKLAVLRGGDPQALNKKASPCTIPGEILNLRQFTRGARDVVDWIRTRQNLSEPDALNWLIHRAEVKAPPNQGQQPNLSDEVSDEVKLALRPIVLEIYQTLQALHGQKSIDVSTLYITGGISKLRGLTDFLSRELRVTVYEWPALSGFQTDLLVAGEDGARRFAVATALAHRFALKKTSGWLNFRRSPQGQRQILTTFIHDLLSPQVRPVVQGFAIAFFMVISYVMLSMVLSGERSANIQKEIVGEFRRLSADVGRQASKFAGDPTRAREIYQKERKRILSESPADEALERLRARSDVLLEISDSLPANTLLKDVVLETRGDDLEIRYTVELAVGGSDALKRLKSSIEQALATRSYRGVKVTELSSQKGVEAVARLSPEEVPYE